MLWCTMASGRRCRDRVHGTTTQRGSPDWVERWVVWGGKRRGLRLRPHAAWYKWTKRQRGKEKRRPEQLDTPCTELAGRALTSPLPCGYGAPLAAVQIARSLKERDGRAGGDPRSTTEAVGQNCPTRTLLKDSGLHRRRSSRASAREWYEAGMRARERAVDERKLPSRAR